MDKQCDFCVASRPVVYCKADAAYLCLLCDAKVHSANALSSRHPRTLLCDLCRCHPARLRCLDHDVFMCRSCDSGHRTSCQQQRRSVNSYAGCPSATDLAALWRHSSTLSEVTSSGKEPSSSSSSATQAKGVEADALMQSSYALHQIMDLDRLELSDGAGKELSVKNDAQADYCDGELLELDASFWECKSPVDSNEIWMQDLGFCDDPRYLDNVTIPDVDPKFQNLEDIFGDGGGSMENAFFCTGQDSSSGKGEQLCGSRIQVISPFQQMSVLIAKEGFHALSLQLQKQDSSSRETSIFDQPNGSSYSTSSSSISKIITESSGCEYKDDGYSPTREKVIMRYKEKKTARHEKQAEYAAARDKSAEKKGVKFR